MGVIDVLDRQHQGTTGEAARGTPAGDRASQDRALAFHRLADLHLARCYRLAAVVLGDQAEAQDAVHDAFVMAWRKYDTLRDPARFAAWFDRIIVNTCRDQMRHDRHLQVHALSVDVDVAGADPISPIADAVVMRRALARLEPDDRLLLALRYYRDMPVDDVAAAMDIHPRAASSRLHRALGRLRHILDEDQRKVAP